MTGSRDRIHELPPEFMFLRPTRQATARCADDAGQALPLVARNELNEQHRPGALVLFPQAFKETRDAKVATRWVTRLLRRLPIVSGP